MKIEDARYDYYNDIPVLRLKLDGIEVVIDPYQKPYLIENGIVSIPLPAQHLDLLPPVNVPGDRRQGIKGYTLDCCATKDKTVLRLTKALIKAVEDDSFRPGAVKI